VEGSVRASIVVEEVAMSERMFLPRTEPPGLRSLVRLTTAAFVIAALYFASTVLIPITLAILLSLVLAPLVDTAQRTGLSRAPAALVAMIAAAGVIVVLAGAVGQQIADLTQELPRYEATIASKARSIEDATLGWASRLMGRIRHDLQPSGGPVVDAASQQGEQSAASSAAAAANQFPSAMSLVGTIVSPVLNPLATLGIVLIISLFILLQKEDLRDRIIRLFGAHDLHPGNLAIDDARRLLSRYFLTRLAINSVYGLVIAAGLFVVGVPKPIVWGLLALVLRFIPYFGWIIAAALPAALAVAIDPGWSLALLTIAVFAVTETITGQIVEPTVFGRSTGLSPFAIVVSSIVWGWLWGPIGLILSTPLTLCLVVLGRHFQSLQFLDVILGDRPVPVAAENVPSQDGLPPLPTEEGSA
jgi:predicted PurR-regulated permease PerM